MHPATVTATTTSRREDALGKGKGQKGKSAR